MAINVAKICIFMACSFMSIQQASAMGKEHDLCQKTASAEPIETRIPSSHIFIIPDWNVAQALDMLQRKDFLLLGKNNLEQLVGMTGGDADVKYYLVKYVSADANMLQASNVGAFWQNDGKLILYYYALGSGEAIFKRWALILMLDRSPRTVDIYCLSAQ